MEQILDKNKQGQEGGGWGLKLWKAHTSRPLHNSEMLRNEDTHLTLAQHFPNLLGQDIH